MTPIRMERVEAGVRTIISLAQAFNQRDLPGILRLYSDNCIMEASSSPPDGAGYQGKPSISQFWQDYFMQYPQAHLKIEETIGFGLRCLARWRCESTDAFGTTSTHRGVDLFRVQNGLITEQLSYIKV